MSGKKIKDLRKASGMTQSQLGKAALGHKDGTYISKIESGAVKDPGAKVIASIARILRKPFEDLMDDTNTAV